MEIQKFIYNVEKQFNATLPFVIYSLPDSNTVVALLQKDATLHLDQEYKSPSFIMAPFDYEGEALTIFENNATIIETSGFLYKKPAITSSSIPHTEAEKDTHISLVASFKKEILTQKVEKVVASRKQEFEIRKFDIASLIQSIFSDDTTAFKYIWYHPQTGIWCGITPETLVKSDGKSFKTMALAGTKKNIDGSKPEWGTKELNEQQLVTDTIVTDLQKVTSVLKTTNAKTVQAGSLYHLKTEITGILKNGKATIPSITKILHPTAAVCGVPKKTAKKLIKDLEGYNRAFYTGFLGPVNLNNTGIELFVNLRCMHILNTTATIYVGGGITKGSVPEDEWIETKNKMETMYQILFPML